MLKMGRERYVILWFFYCKYKYYEIRTVAIEPLWGGGESRGRIGLPVFQIGVVPITIAA